MGDLFLFWWGRTSKLINSCHVYLELISCKASPSSFCWFWMINILFCEEGTFNTNSITCIWEKKYPLDMLALKSTGHSISILHILACCETVYIFICGNGAPFVGLHIQKCKQSCKCPSEIHPLGRQMQRYNHNWDL